MYADAINNIKTIHRTEIKEVEAGYESEITEIEDQYKNNITILKEEKDSLTKLQTQTLAGKNAAENKLTQYNEILNGIGSEITDGREVLDFIKSIKGQNNTLKNTNNTLTSRNESLREQNSKLHEQNINLNKLFEAMKEQKSRLDEIKVKLTTLTKNDQRHEIESIQAELDKQK